jgi:hypothetical protein
MIWAAGGSEAIVLHDKNDPAVKSEVAALLAKLATDWANGIDRIVGEDILLLALDAIRQTSFTAEVAFRMRRFSSRCVRVS